jgi:capsule polysaccharide modification protein KpsS
VILVGSFLHGVAGEDEEEDVRSYWMNLRTGEDTLI